MSCRPTIECKWERARGEGVGSRRRALRCCLIRTRRAARAPLFRSCTRTHRCCSSRVAVRLRAGRWPSRTRRASSLPRCAKHQTRARTRAPCRAASVARNNNVALQSTRMVCSSVAAARPHTLPARPTLPPHPNTHRVCACARCAARRRWATTSDTDETYDTGCLVVANIDNSMDGDGACMGGHATHTTATPPLTHTSRAAPHFLAPLSQTRW
jgi:hypothetical protein